MPKLKGVNICLHRPIPEGIKIKSATICQTPAGNYYISILVEYEQETVPIIPVEENIVGLDYASRTLYMDSNGNSADYPQFYRKSEARLKKEQRKLSHRKKGGKNRKKQRLKVARLHEKVTNQRKDFLHKQSSNSVGGGSASLNVLKLVELFWVDLLIIN